MLYAIRWTDPHGVTWWLRPACFEGAEYRWSSSGMPALSMKFSAAADAAAVAAAQEFPCEVVVVAPGHEYADPAPAGPPAAGPPPASLNGKAHEP